MKVLVLLSTYNGEKYLQEQLNSLYRQTIPVEILVRDDSSSDRTQEILKENAGDGKLKWYTGENLKPAKSFWDLVHNAQEADYYCFCDQDDVWYDDKIERAIKKLEEVEKQNQPLLYCSNVLVTDDKLNALNNFNKSIKVYTDFAHSLIYSLAPGCTMVFNQKARNELIKYDMNVEFEIIHDWLAHKIVAMLGRVIYDSEPSMFYRQHGNNVIGAQKENRVNAFIKKVFRVLGKHANTRSNSAKSLLSIYGKQINEEQLELLNMVANYRKNKQLKKKFLNTKIFDISNKSYLKWVIRLNKV